MKMREEIDALRTMGLDPVEVLVLPRIIALVIAVPLLTFLGSMAALYGAGLVCWLYAGMAPDIFLERLREAIWLPTFEVGMIKAPFMALMIGLVACVEGFEVEGSAASLGLKTTASVVKSIFMVIALDGVFRHVLCRHRDVSDDRQPADHQRPRPGRRLRCARPCSITRASTCFGGEILGFVGGSGAGKVGADARHHRAGAEAQGHDRGVRHRSRRAQRSRSGAAIEQRWGVLFQQGALFSSLTALQNVQFPMREYLRPVAAADGRDRARQTGDGRT